MVMMIQLYDIKNVDLVYLIMNIRLIDKDWPERNKIATFEIYPSNIVYPSCKYLNWWTRDFLSIYYGNKDTVAIVLRRGVWRKYSANSRSLPT